MPSTTRPIHNAAAGFVRTSFDVPVDLLRRARIKAIHENTTLTAVLRTALERFVSEER